MKLTGARKLDQMAGMEKLPGIVNYFRGNDPKKWHTNIPTYRKAKFAGIYNGVDMVYYGAQDGRLEHDFVVKPGADPKQIKLAFSGASSAIVTAEGDLALKTEAGVVCWHKPVTYQLIDGKRQPVACAYKLEREGGVSAVQFAVSRYDSCKPLIIDFVLQYSTYLGGLGNEEGYGIAVDSSGNAYVTGQTTWKDFPTTTGAFQATQGGYDDAFVAKFTFPLINDAIGLGPLTGKGGKVLYTGARLITYNGIPIVGRNMDFLIDGVKIGTVVTDVNGAARLYSLLPQETPAGAHTLTASFAGDNTYKAVSKTVALTVQQSNTTLSVYAQTGAPGKVKNLVCRLFNEVGRVANNRTVTYSIGATAIGTVVTNSLGCGNLAYTIPDTLGAGPQTFTVTFAGDTVYNGSTR